MSPEDRKELARLFRKVLTRHDARRRQFQKKAPAYTAGVFADKVGKTLAQVHAWCRDGQIIAYRLEDSRSGPHREWRIPHAELLRYQKEGLYPRYSVEAFAKELMTIEEDCSLSKLCTLIESWCNEGLVKAKKCPHGWRISSQELKRYVKEGSLRKTTQD